MDPLERLIGVKELAEILGIPRSSIWRACREGFLPHYRYGRLIRFRLQEVLLSLKHGIGKTAIEPGLQDLARGGYNPQRVKGVAR